MTQPFRFEDEPKDTAGTLTLTLAGLLKLPAAALNEFIEFWRLWRELAPETKARFAMLVNPGLSPEQVGLLCGRSGRTVYRYVPKPRKRAKPGRPDRRSSAPRYFGHPRDEAEASD